MATLDAIMTEITDAAKFIRRRKSQMPETMTTSLMKSICSKVAAISTFGTGEATKLFYCIEAATLPDHMEKMLTDACDSRMAVHLSSEVVVPRGPSSGAPPRDQTIRYVNNYPTASMWDVLEDPKSNPAQRDTTLASLLTSLGIRRASEEGCIKWAMVVLLHVENNATGTWPSYRAIYNRVPQTSTHTHTHSNNNSNNNHNDNNVNSNVNSNNNNDETTHTYIRK